MQMQMKTITHNQISKTICINKMLLLAMVRKFLKSENIPKFDDKVNVWINATTELSQNNYELTIEDNEIFISWQENSQKDNQQNVEIGA